MSREGAKFLTLVVLMLVALAGTVWAIATDRLTEDWLRAVVEAGGIWSPVVFIVAATLLPLAWVPRMMTSIVAGAMFGFWAGSLLALLGGVGGALSAYWMGHALGHEWVMKKIGVKGKAVVDFLARHGFLAITLGRISPITNCEAISLGSGLMGLPMRVYLPSTIAGMLPGSFLYAGFGSSVLTKDAAWVSVVSAVVAIAMTAATGWWLWRMWKKDKAEQAALGEARAPEEVA